MTAEERRAELIVHATLLLVLSVVLVFAVWWLVWWSQPPTEGPVTPMTAAPPVPYQEETP